MTHLANGLLGAVTGVTQLLIWRQTAAEGSGDLADAIAQAGDGAEQLADGQPEAAVGLQEVGQRGWPPASDGSAPARRRQPADLGRRQ